jgi:hypothetical protein
MSGNMNLPESGESDFLAVLSAAPADAVIAFAEAAIPELGAFDVLSVRTALTTLPYDGLDKAGELLLTEAHIQLEDGTEGYSACLGVNRQQALSVALLDAVLLSKRAPRSLKGRLVSFVEQQEAALSQAEYAAYNDFA